VANPPSTEARREAVRLLSADASSRDLLAGILDDTNEHLEVRSVSARSLQSVAPDEFERRARAIVLNDDDDDALRATLLGGLAHAAGNPALRDDDELSRHVEKLSRSVGEALARTAERFVIRQRKL
jgi:hypothetical protein